MTSAINQSSNKAKRKSEALFATMSMPWKRRSALSITILIVMLSARVTRALSTTASLPSLELLQSAPTSLTTFAVHNPADGSIVGHVEGQHDTQRCLQQSRAAFTKWKSTTAVQRASYLQTLDDLLKQHADELATIMTLESGKPIVESRAEVNYARSFLSYYSGQAVAPNGMLVPTPFVNVDQSPKGQLIMRHEPVGVSGLITPWNFPLAMLTRKLGPALAAGCTVIIKPSELTPFTALALQALTVHAGLPDHVVQTMTPDAEHTPQVGRDFCNSPTMAKLSFTGSTKVGKQLMEWSATTVKRLSLELGGNAPFVVFDEADLKVAVTAAMASKFRFSGQTCVCADRFLIHSSRYQAFVHALTERAEQLRVGPGLDEQTEMGPLITKQAVQTVHQKVQAAIADGATLCTGGRILDELGPQYYAPTIVTNVSLDSELWKTETFGPVVAIRTFESDEEALEICNNSRAGLASYFITSNLQRVFQFSQALESGLVGVNEGVISTCYAPFGGVKESGLGREGSPLGLQEYQEVKYIFVNDG